MFQKSDVHSHTQAPDSSTASAPEARAAVSPPKRRTLLGSLLDAGAIVVMGVLLFWGATTQFSNQYNDATRYQCYSVAFWQGMGGLKSLPTQQCAFFQASASASFAQKMQQRHFPSILVHIVEKQSTSQPFHALPPEYPLLTLAPFSLALIVPQQWYQVAFAFWMAVTAGIIYLLLARYRSRPAAIAFAAYLVIGSWATAEGRFDLVTAALTLGAVILAAKARWNWAYFVLAVATLLKFYPILLVPPLLIAQWQLGHTRWNSWQFWKGPAVYIATGVVVTAVSLLLNVANTIEPFRYFFARPIQIESFPATLVWFGSFLGYTIQYPFTFQSQNVASALSNKISLLCTFISVAGLLYVYWLHWRGKLDIFASSLLTLLVVIIMGKVLSPQYLMWVAPFVAYVGKSNWKWVLTWGIACALTTVIYPNIYIDLPHIIKYYPIVVARDFLILAMTLVLLLYYARLQTKAKREVGQ